ncbi:UNVERIFIED_CONTAM: hypothetical protein GTU68_061866 [Idotea baltica]|nr:hypothetical protein [Idotea baltica]
MHCLAPFMGVVPVLLSFAVIPFGPPISYGDTEVSMQLANLNVGILYVFAMGSLAVYGTVLAGWVSHNKFSMFGSLRASAQMISYEITMGLSIIGLLMSYGTLDLNKIVEAQGGLVWGFLPAIAFFIFFISLMAETKRNPFDLPESESELVAGYFTEYSGMKFLFFWLGEFAEIVVASALVVVLFFGGWQLPLFTIDAIELGSIIAPHVFAAKVAFFCVLQVVIRWTVPRFRYDQVMNLCWKIMLPIAIVNLLLSAVFFLLTN